MSALLLAVDVGNTRFGAALFRGEELVDLRRTRTARRGGPEACARKLRSLLDRSAVAPESVAGMAVSCVVPALADTVREAGRRLGLDVRFAGRDLHVDLPLRYHPPDSLGADRLVNSFAALRRFGAPVIVVDLGTAAKYDLVGPGGSYEGGLIAPGPGTALAGLWAAAPHLPPVELRRVRRLLGRTTRECLESGAYYGLVAHVQGIVRLLRLLAGAEAPVVATGGVARLLAGRVEEIDFYCPNLTLEGLNLAWNERPASAR